jgi:hypothetical protein
MNMRTKLIGTIVVGAALLVPVAQAERPDDKAGLRGPGAFASDQESTASHPDNRAGIRGPGALAGDQRASVRPDDRAGVRGPGAIGSPEDVVVNHPDNRAGARGPGAVTTALFQPSSTGFDWGDALIGVFGGAGTALLITGSAFLLMSRRNRVRTA